MLNSYARSTKLQEILLSLLLTWVQFCFRDSSFCLWVMTHLRLLSCTSILQLLAFWCILCSFLNHLSGILWKIHHQFKVRESLTILPGSTVHQIEFQIALNLIFLETQLRKITSWEELQMHESECNWLIQSKIRSVTTQHTNLANRISSTFLNLRQISSSSSARIQLKPSRSQLWRLLFRIFTIFLSIIRHSSKVILSKLSLYLQL